LLYCLITKVTDLHLVAANYSNHFRLVAYSLLSFIKYLIRLPDVWCLHFRGLTDESEIVKFLQNGTLVGLLPVPHPILIRKYQSNSGTAVWFRNYLWGVIYLRNVTPPIWYDTNVRLFEIQRVQN
ncbi:uncharacterized protein DEA37_0000884, partial [Paragonimus westermani]